MLDYDSRAVVLSTTCRCCLSLVQSPRRASASISGYAAWPQLPPQCRSCCAPRLPVSMPVHGPTSAKRQREIHTRPDKSARTISDQRPCDWCFDCHLLKAIIDQAERAPDEIAPVFLIKKNKTKTNLVNFDQHCLCRRCMQPALMSRYQCPRNQTHAHSSLGLSFITHLI